LAPDEYAGFTMTLLRMLAFAPADQGNPAPRKKADAPAPLSPAGIPSAYSATERIPEPEPVHASSETPPAPIVETNAMPPTKPAHSQAFDGDWRSLVDNLKLGLARALAQNCELVRHEEHAIHLSVPEAQKHLLEASYQEKLRTAITQHFGRKIQLHFAVGGSGNTPAQQRIEEQAALQSQAVSAIQQDDFVQALVKDFGAQIIPSSIKPV